MAELSDALDGLTRLVGQGAGSSNAARFPDLVASNPQGWGTAPPRQYMAAPQQELRNPPSLWDYVEKYGAVPAKIATDVAMQPVRAGEAVGEAAMHPSIANVTNAATQTGMALFQPGKAIGALGAGYGLALAKDLGLWDAMSPSEALAGKEKKPETVPEMPGLSPEQNAELFRAKKTMMNGDAPDRATRNMLADTIKRLEGISGDFVQRNQDQSRALETAKKQAEQQEYDRAVAKAEGERDRILKTDRRFSTTETGQLFEKTGGLAPFIGGVGLGGLSRAATGGGNSLYNYGLPAALGGITGIAANNIPLAYNAFLTEPDNPQKLAYEAYARELPATHPRKAEWAAYADTLPADNPVRKSAAAELYDPTKAVERSAFGLAEGVAGGLAGADIMRLPGRLVEGLSATPGRAQAAYYASAKDAAIARSALNDILAESNAGKSIANKAVVDAETANAVSAVAGRDKGRELVGATNSSPEPKKSFAAFHKAVQEQLENGVHPAHLSEDMFPQLPFNLASARLSKYRDIIDKTGMSPDELAHALMIARKVGR